MDLNFYGRDLRESGVACFATKKQATAAHKQVGSVFRYNSHVVRAATRFHWFYVIVSSRPVTDGIRWLDVLTRDGHITTMQHPGYRQGDMVIQP